MEAGLSCTKPCTKREVFDERGQNGMKAFFKILKKNKIPHMSFILFYITMSLIVPVTYVLTQIIIGEMGQSAFEFDTSAIFRFMLS